MEIFYIKKLSEIGRIFLTIVFLGFCAGVAHAYNEDDCNRMFGSANVEKVEKFKIQGGEADFGDDLHLIGSPQGDAVVCWSIDGRVAVKGKLYSDNFRDPQVAQVRIRFRRTNGNVTGTTRRSLATQGGVVASREVEKVSPVGSFNRVRIRVNTDISTDLGLTSTPFVTRNFDR